MPFSGNLCPLWNFKFLLHAIILFCNIFTDFDFLKLLADLYLFVHLFIYWPTEGLSFCLQYISLCSPQTNYAPCSAEHLSCSAEHLSCMGLHICFCIYELSIYQKMYELIEVYIHAFLTLARKACVQFYLPANVTSSEGTRTQEAGLASESLLTL